MAALRPLMSSRCRFNPGVVVVSVHGVFCPVKELGQDPFQGPCVEYNPFHGFMCIHDV
jgi:hypothetical protein